MFKCTGGAPSHLRQPRDFAPFDLGLRFFLQPSSPQALDRSEEPSFWTHVTIHVKQGSLLQGAGKKKQQNHLFKRSSVLLSLLALKKQNFCCCCVRVFFNKKITFVKRRKMQSLLQKGRIPEFCRGTLIVASCCLRKGSTELTYERKDREKDLCRDSEQELG